MAGAGFDARMISDADRGTKDRLGRAAYVVTGIKNPGASRVKATVEVDGTLSIRARSCACWPRTSARYSAGSRLSPRRNRTTGGSSWGW
jgi:diacylglycerol kinase family enzyme